MSVIEPRSMSFSWRNEQLPHSGQKETETAAFASLTAADIVRAPIVQRRMPVDFRPLLKPHKKAGRLCLRIERMAQGARISAGRRNTDNSWSLASDELEDLHYPGLVQCRPGSRAYRPDNEFRGWRGIDLEGVQYVVSASDAVPEQTGRDPHGHDPVIPSQLSEMHSLFAVRESELTELGRPSSAQSAKRRPNSSRPAPTGTWSLTARSQQR